MDLELIKEKQVPLLKRKRVTLKYSAQSRKTPSRTKIVGEVAKKIGVKEDTIAIRHIYTQFGKSSSKIIAHVYKDKKTMDLYENKKLLEKQAKKEEPKAEESAPAAEAPVEAPAEEAPAPVEEKTEEAPKVEEPKAEEAKPAEAKEEAKKEKSE